MMHSEEYERAHKEFKRCLIMGIPGLFVPFYNAFKYWKPIMDEELRKEKLNENAGGTLQENNEKQ